MSAKEVADLLAVSDSTVRRYVRSGILPKPFKMGNSGHRRFRASDVVEAIGRMEGGDDSQAFH